MDISLIIKVAGVGILISILNMLLEKTDSNIYYISRCNNSFKYGINWDKRFIYYSKNYVSTLLKRGRYIGSNANYRYCDYINRTLFSNKER